MKAIDGTCVRYARKHYYYIKQGKSLLVPTQRVFDSWNFNNVPKIEESEYKQFRKSYPVVGTLGFRPGTLIKNYADGKVYVIENNKRRHIQDPDILNEYGLDKNKMFLVSPREINLHKEGDPLGGDTV